MLRIKFIAVVVCLTFLVAPAQENDIQQKLESRLNEVFTKAGYPGVTAALALPDGRVLTAAAGWADRDHRIPLKPSDRMYAGSVGKMFVSAVILKTVEDGTLDLDSKIERWVGREPWFGRLPNARQLTLRLLLSHRSGIEDYHTNSRAFWKAITDSPSKTWAPLELASYAFDKKPSSSAGTKYSYSDMNYIIAGLVFETATGRKLFAEVDRRILKPLHLDLTTPIEGHTLDNLARGQISPKNPIGVKGETIQEGRELIAFQAEYAGGGLISNSGDLARWAKSLFEGDVLSKRQLAEMLKGLPADKDGKYGLGVGIDSSEAGPVYGHDGWTIGYQTSLAYFRDYKIAAAIQVNSDPNPAFKITLDTCLGRVAGTYLADKLPKKESR
ncbi:MAG TPA: serine hydrolase domain-containing protein [Blastocatellia bacterium]|nr:serine hydrolase domain-containing protein [Blastocatellia bacterium]